jgi:hypothetical protein
MKGIEVTRIIDGIDDPEERTKIAEMPVLTSCGETRSCSAEDKEFLCASWSSDDSGLLFV